MHGRNRLVAILAGTALAAVAGCSAGSPQVFRPAGHAQPAAQTDTLKTHATTAPGGFRFPPGVAISFSSPLPASAERRAIVTGYQDYVLSLWAGVLSHGRDTAYRRLASGNAQDFIRQEITFFAHRGIQGSIRYSQTAVSAVYFGNGATVTSCVDASGFNMTPAGAGPVFPPKFSRYLEKVAEGRRPDGTWFVAHTESFSASTSEGAMCR
jgi:hypothetical protein